LGSHHFGIGEPRKLRHPGQHRQSYRCESSRFDRREVPSAAFDVEQVLPLPEQARSRCFYGGVAAPVKDQRRLLSQQPRGVDPEPERISFTSSSLFVAPKTLHGRQAPRATAGTKESRPRGGKFTVRPCSALMYAAISRRATWSPSSKVSRAGSLP